MIRNRLFTNNHLYLVLAAALLAVAMLVINLLLPGSLPVVYPRANEPHSALELNRAQQAEADRWQAQADAYYRQLVLQYYAQHPDRIPLNRVQLADAARLTGQAIQYGLLPEEIPPDLQRLLGK